jgi:hypothetical protein
MSMTGWEIHDTAGQLLRDGETSQIAAFLREYGALAAYDDNFNTLAVLRKYHPVLNCAPEDDPDGNNDFSMRIGFYTPMMETFFYVPKTLTYRRLKLVAPAAPGISAPDYMIETAEFGVTRTNNYELSSQLAPGYQPVTEDAMREAFATFSNARPPLAKRIPITSTHIDLPSAGRFEQSDFSDWFSATMLIPLVDAVLPVTVMKFHPNDPAQAHQLAKFDAAIAAFLRLGAGARQGASVRVLKNCHDYIETVGEADWNVAMAAIREPDAIWAFVYPKDVHVRYDHGTDCVYVLLACACDWEEEHGLQLVYRDGSVLTRVSEQDGHFAE